MILKSTLDAELDRLDGIEAAAQRYRFACLARCDFDGASRAWQDIKAVRREKQALITGELFPGTDET